MNESREGPVTLRLSYEDLRIERKQPSVANRIAYASLKSLNYEKSAHHRLSQGVAAGIASPGVGLIVGATKAKEHWLVIDYVDNFKSVTTLLRLDKREYRDIIAELEKRTGKSVTITQTAAKDLDPTIGSQDVDETVPFATEIVARAVRLAMVHVGCELQRQDPLLYNANAAAETRTSQGSVERW